MYLDFAELQALSRQPMYMKDWINKLDDFLRVSAREILLHTGGISHEAALDKARAEYTKYHQQLVNAISPIEHHFLEAVKEMEQITADKT